MKHLTPLDSKKESDNSSTRLYKSHNICDVWSQTFREELDRMSDLVLNHGFNYIFFDTEFAGFLSERVAIDYDYEDLQANVAQMKIIQLGFTISNTNGQTPAEADLQSYCEKNGLKQTDLPGSWQFNFQFNVKHDRYQPEALKLLKEAGIDFQRLASHQGVKPQNFAQHFRMSGLGSNKKITWLAFNAMHDFGYLLNFFHQPLPQSQTKFLDRLRELCPRYYDVKHAGQGSLTSQLTQAGIQMTDYVQHQAGSDSLATMKLYWARWNEKAILSHINQVHKLNCSCDDGFILKSKGISSIQKPRNDLKRYFEALIKVMNAQGYQSTVPLPQMQSFFERACQNQFKQNQDYQNGEIQSTDQFSAINKLSTYQQQPKLNTGSDCFNPCDDQRRGNSAPLYQYNGQYAIHTYSADDQDCFSVEQLTDCSQNAPTLYYQKSDPVSSPTHGHRKELKRFYGEEHPISVDLNDDLCEQAQFRDQQYNAYEYPQQEGMRGLSDGFMTQKMGEGVNRSVVANKSKWHYKRVRKCNGLF